MSHHPRKSSPAVVIVLCMLGMLLLYFVPLALVLLDELVFRTFYISKALPEWCEEVFRLMYWPLIDR